MLRTALELNGTRYVIEVSAYGAKVRRYYPTVYRSTPSAGRFTSTILSAVAGNALAPNLRETPEDALEHGLVLAGAHAGIL